MHFLNFKISVVLLADILANPDLEAEVELCYQLGKIFKAQSQTQIPYALHYVYLVGLQSLCVFLLIIIIIYSFLVLLS